MKLKLKLILVFLLIGIFFFSCSKEDSETSENSQNGGEISRFQIVTVDVGSTILNNNTYAGTFNNLPIQLAKIDNNKLVFYVTETTPLGKARLVIPEINNLKITYDVIDVALSQTAQLTLQPLVEYEQTYFNTITSTPENVTFIQNHNSFMTFLNNLNSVDIDKAAKFYKVNKNIIDPVYTTDYSLIQGRNSVALNNDFDFAYYKSLINKHKAAVAITIIAGAFAVLPPYEPVETTLAIGVACAGIYKSKEFHGEILTDVFRVIEINLGGVNGINNRFNNSTNSNLTFTDGQISILPFQVNAKNFKNSDSSIQKQYLQLFFEAKSKLNYFISGINTTIDWVNDNVPLVNFSSIPLTSVPNNSGGSSFDANSQIMQGFSFSLNHPNLSLQSASLTSTGQLSVKIKIIGNPTTVPVTSTLNYSYNDDFSTFSGSFPITVTQNILIVGQNYQGGIIAYILQQGDSGYDANVQHGIIVTPSEVGAAYTWGCYSVTVSGTSTAIGSGQSNTNLILNTCSGAAASACNNYSLSGYSDWYLPSLGELQKIYQNLHVNNIGGFQDAIYWSSTQSNASSAWGVDFSNGTSDPYVTLQQAFRVRPVRSF
ncbi:DUF1566 domain-containing protein [Flavobacterium sp.]|jgi:hypothetical protein|uniref:DUF1566 domain-containing protein n=1 Tax=Flavobacterium sp. TaxID=239 RepID=UPI0037847212